MSVLAWLFIGRLPAMEQPIDECRSDTTALQYYRIALLSAVIKSFRDREAERLWRQENSRSIPKVLYRAAIKKLQMLNAAGALEDLFLPPGNRLERLKGDREGQHSIRINDQYRVCFVWRDGNAYEVEVADYH
jgi:proteic killer suppression protein